MAAPLLAVARLPSKTSGTRRVLPDTSSSSIPRASADHRTPNHLRDHSYDKEPFPTVDDSPLPAGAIDDAPVRNGYYSTDAPNDRRIGLRELEKNLRREELHGGRANSHKDAAVHPADRQDRFAKHRDVHQWTSPVEGQHPNNGHRTSPSGESLTYQTQEPRAGQLSGSESPAWPTYRRASAARPSTSPAPSNHSPRLFSDEDRGSYFAITPQHPSSTNIRSPLGLPAGFSPVGAPQVRPSTSGEASPSARSPYTSPDLSVPLRSPPFRRPPASRSAHGIETAFGPPPALSTQRSYSTDSWRRAVAAANSDRGLGLLVPAGQGQTLKGQSPTSPTKGAADSLTFQALEQLDAAAQFGEGKSQLENNTTTDLENREIEGGHEEELEETISSDQLGRTHHSHRLSAEDDANSPMDTKISQLPTATPQRRSLLGTVRPRANSKRISANLPPEPVAQEGQSQSSHEDLFLDLAKGEDYRTPSSKEESKPSRIALPSHRPSVSHTGIGAQDGEVKSSPLSHIRRRSLQRAAIETPPQSPVTTRNPSLKQRSYAASAHPLDSQRVPSRLTERTPQPILTNVARSKEERSPELPSRRQSVTENFSRPYRSSYLQSLANGNSYSSPVPPRGQHAERERTPPPLRHEGTESTVSTTAPSTVWDELDDLKSRIRNLELTGKLPSSSAATSGNRPQTATTTVTTISSSPKRARQHSLSPAEPGTDGEDSLHPLLHSALAKAQLQLTDAAYRALESCANDALAISQTSTSTQHQSVAQSTLERTLKRRADNLCRSMTELCIALAEPRGPFSPGERRGSTSRPGSRSGTATLRRPDLTIDTETRYARAQSLDPEPTSARVLSRLEARRSSLAGGRSGGEFLSSSRDTSHSRRTSPSREREASNADPATATTPTQSTLGRYATVTQRRHLDGLDPDRTLRPLSRSRTDASSRATLGPLAGKRASREYTSQYPLPSPSATMPGEGRSPLATPRDRAEARRSYLSNTVSSSMRRTERDTKALSEARAADEDDTLTLPTTPSTTIGPDDRRRSLVEARERRRAREEGIRDDQQRLNERYVDAPQEQPRFTEHNLEQNTHHGVPNGVTGVNGEVNRFGGRSWQEKYSTVREGRRVEGRGDERPSGIAVQAGAASSGSAALERAQKRLSGSYAGSRLSGQFTKGIRPVPRD